MKAATFPLLASLTATILIGAANVEAPSADQGTGLNETNTAPRRTFARQVHYRSTTIDDVEIFYREAGSRENPTVLLLHGFPTSSHMFRNLIPALAGDYHLIAPDYPGFGNSSMPAVDEFDYTFDRLAEIIESLVDQLDLDSYSIYVMDYGAPVGYRLAAKYPERVESLIVQNGNAYDEGLREFWDPIKAYWADRIPEKAEPLLRESLEIDRRLRGDDSHVITTLANLGTLLSGLGRLDDAERMLHDALEMRRRPPVPG